MERHTAFTWADTGPHTDPFCRLYYINGGTGELLYNSRVYTLSKGNFYLFPGSLPIFHKPSPGLNQYYVHFTAQLAGGMSLFDVTEWDCVRKAPDSRAACRIMSSIIDEPDSPSGMLARQSELQGIVAGFLTGFSEVSSRGEFVRKRFAAVLEHIHGHITERISIYTLAGLAGLHPNYFSNLFTDIFGMPPREYILRKRTERAQLLLWTTGMPVKQVADAAGFEDASYFCRVFRRRVGMTPQMYRRQDVQVRA